MNKTPILLVFISLLVPAYSQNKIPKENISALTEKSVLDSMESVKSDHNNDTISAKKIVASFNAIAISKQSDTTLIQQITSINTHLDEIEKHQDSDYLFKSATIVNGLMTILVGFLIFRLTRSKEYKFKKSELSGEILQSLSSIKISTIRTIEEKINYEANRRILHFFYDDSYEPADTSDLKSLTYYEALGSEIADKIRDYNWEIAKQKGLLAKFVGQYTPYLSKNKKVIFEKLVSPIKAIEAFSYDFLDVKSHGGVYPKKKKLLLGVEYQFNKFYADKFKELENFINENT